jgi:hypothetical protein
VQPDVNVERLGAVIQQIDRNAQMSPMPTLLSPYDEGRREEDPAIRRRKEQRLSDMRGPSQGRAAAAVAAAAASPMTRKRVEMADTGAIFSPPPAQQTPRAKKTGGYSDTYAALTERAKALAAAQHANLQPQPEEEEEDEWMQAEDFERREAEGDPPAWAASSGRRSRWVSRHPTPHHARTRFRHSGTDPYTNHLAGRWQLDDRTNP